MTSHAPRLPGFALFGALLAAAGLPLYIHAPKFYVDEYGVSLAALGSVLFVLRLLDFVQDPALEARSLTLALATRSGPVPTATVRAVEDAILTRARQLRIRDRGL